MHPLCPTRSKFLVPALLLGLIWQVGACPCGCLHHNLWLGIYERLIGETEPIEPQIAGISMDAHDCDHRPRDSYLRGRTAGEDGEAFSLLPWTAVLASPIAPAGTLSMAPGRPARGLEAARFSNAHEMRAYLQVFRI